MRKRMVTRSITCTDVHIFCVNLEDRSTFEQSITLPSTYKDDEKLMKAVEKALQGEPIKAVEVLGSSTRETLYGMTEEEFLMYSKVLPPRGTKKSAD